MEFGSIWVTQIITLRKKEYFLSGSDGGIVQLGLLGLCSLPIL
jgi:hypothetical protein